MKHFYDFFFVINRYYNGDHKRLLNFIKIALAAHPLVDSRVTESSKQARHSGSAWKTRTFHCTSVGVKTAT